MAPLSRYLQFINVLPQAQIWPPFFPRTSGLSISPKYTTRGDRCTSSWNLFWWFQTPSVALLSRYLPFINLLLRAQIWGPFLQRNCGLSISPKFATRGATCTSRWKVYDVNSSNVSQILSHFPLSIPAYIEVLTNQKGRGKSPMSLHGINQRDLEDILDSWIESWWL